MEAKEKAIQLVNKFSEFVDESFSDTRFNAKQCALIAADEMIKENEAIIEIVRPHSERACWPIAEMVRDLIIMKQEIEKL